MLKPNKVNLARQLRAAPSGTHGQSRRLWAVPLAALALILAVLAVYTWGVRGALLSERARLEGLLSDPGLAAANEAALADLEAHDARVAHLDNLAALAESLNSYNSDYLSWHQHALYAEAGRLGVSIESVRYDRQSGLLILECLGAMAGSPADFAAGLSAYIHDILAVDYGGYRHEASGYRFTLRCAINNITQ